MGRIVIDVREPAEYREGHVEGAINVPLSDSRALEKVSQIANKDDELVVYCRSGMRAGTMISDLRNAGYTKVINGINTATVNSL